MTTGIKVNNKTIVGTKSELVLVRRKWLTDCIFRHSVTKLMTYGDLIRSQDTYEADELLNLMNNKKKKKVY